jgi:hypothetical protein
VASILSGGDTRQIAVTFVHLTCYGFLCKQLKDDGNRDIQIMREQVPKLLPSAVSFRRIDVWASSAVSSLSYHHHLPYFFFREERLVK